MELPNAYRLSYLFDPFPFPQGITGGLSTLHNFGDATVLSPNVYELCGVPTIITQQEASYVVVNLKGTIPVPGSSTVTRCFADFDFKINKGVHPNFHRIVLCSSIVRNEKEKKEAIRKYTSPKIGWYQKINLVGLFLDDPDFLCSEVDDIVGIWQYLNANADELPPQVTRGLTLSDQELKWWKESLNSKICFPSFLSTTKIPGATFLGNVKITINIPPESQNARGARDISAVSQLKQEGEILFNAYSTFMVNTCTIDGDVTHFGLTWIPDETIEITTQYQDSINERQRLRKLWKGHEQIPQGGSSLSMYLLVTFVVGVVVGVIGYKSKVHI